MAAPLPNPLFRVPFQGELTPPEAIPALLITAVPGQSSPWAQQESNRNSCA